MIDLGDALRQLVSELRPQVGDRALQLDVKGDVVGEWDRVRIGQVVSNLVTNAIAYGDSSSPITIGADGTDEKVVTLSVHNTGQPIPAGLIPTLFEAFRRGRTRVAGLGLGLFIVRHVAHAHGGDIEVDSTRDRGTTFTVRLPRWRGPDAPHRE